MPRKRRQMGGIDQLPSGRYRVRVVDPATGRRASVGTYKAKADAERAFSRALADQGRGAWVPPDRGRLTVSEYASRWLDSRLTSRGEPLRPRVRDLYQDYLRLHILPTLGPVALGRLSTATVRSWHGELLADGPGLSTVAKCYRLVRAVLNTAVEDGLIASNPCKIKGAGVEPDVERAIPTIAEVYELAEAVYPRYRAMVLLAAFGGLRRGELLALPRRNVDLLHRCVTVDVQRQAARGGDLVGPPKSDAGKRTLALSPELAAELEAHLAQWGEADPDSLVFTGVKGGPLRPRVWQSHWDQARRSLGLTELHFHDLRHVAGTLAAATGASTKELMHRLGHASPRAALRYQHATAPRDTAIANAMEELIKAARSTPQAEVRRLAVDRRRGR